MHNAGFGVKNAQDTTRDIILRRVHATIVAVEIKHYVVWVCVCVCVCV